MTRSYHGVKEVNEMSVTVTPLTPAVGAEVANVDLRSLDDDAFARIERAWHRHSALLFRSSRRQGHGRRALDGDGRMDSGAMS